MSTRRTHPGCLIPAIALASVALLGVAVIPSADAADGTFNALTVTGTATFRHGVTVSGWGSQFTGPIIVNQDAAGHVGLIVNANANAGTAQVATFFDHAGNPIFSIPPYGGPAVFGDNFRLFAPGQVFEAALTLWLNGSITLGGVQQGGLAQGGVTLYSGAADPTVTPPSTLTSAAAGGNPAVYRAFMPGDRYWRSNGETYVYLGGVWVLQ